MSLDLFVRQLVEGIKATEKELEYLKEQVKEQREIIEQLTGTGKPRNYTYMHPMDVAELVERVNVADAAFVDIFKGCKTLPDDVLSISGRNIKQSANIPPVTRLFS